MGPRVWFVLFALLLSGCAATVPAPADPTPETTIEAASIKDVAQVFELPAGDSFVALLMNFTPKEAIDVGSIQTHCLLTDTSEFKGEVFIQESRYSVKSNQAKSAMTASFHNREGGGGVGVTCGGDTPDQPRTYLIVFVLHTENAGKLRIAIPASFDQHELLSENIPGVAIAQGEAQLSYYLAINTPGGFAASHNVAVDQGPAPPGKTATAGTLVISTHHDTNGTTLEHANARVSAPGDLTVGRCEGEWTSDVGTKTTRTLFADALLAAPVIPGFSFEGLSSRPTSAKATLDGASAGSIFWIAHSSVPLDLSAIGLQEEPSFSLYSPEIAPPRTPCAWASFCLLAK